MSGPGTLPATRPIATWAVGVDVATGVEIHVARYLLDRGLLTAHDVVGGSVEFEAVPGHNTVVQVRRTTGPSYLVKRHRGGRHSTRREATAYEVLRTTGDAMLASALPEVVLRDEPAATLVLSLTPLDSVRGAGATDTADLADVAAHVARLMAAVHRTRRCRIPEFLRSDATSRHTRILEPDGTIMAYTSRAALQLLAVAQADRTLATALAELQTVNRAEAFIHGDVRWSNVLSGRHPGTELRPALHIIDWETAGLGAAAWDVACLLAENLGDWLSSVPKSVPSDVARNFRRASSSLYDMQRTNATFWTTYTTARALAGKERGELLQRAVRLVGARLIARGLELDHANAVCSVDAATHVQFGAQILATPPSATSYLLGLDDARRPT